MPRTVEDLLGAAHSRRALWVIAFMAGLASSVAWGRPPALSLDLQPGVAFPLGGPQADRFSVGGGVSLKGAVELARFFDLQVGGTFLGFSGSDGGIPTVWGVGGGVRFKRPYPTGSFHPWLDGDALYVRTGPLNRFGYAVGAGVGFPVLSSRTLWLGLFVRYLQVVQPSRAGFDNTDAKILVAGLSAELSTPQRQDTDGDGVPDRSDRCPTVAGPKENGGCPEPDSDGDGLIDRLDKCPTTPGPKDNAGCPYTDRDSDGVLDRDDRCPTVPGPRDNAGCPYPDSDGDGLLDRDDKCPTVPGPKENAGCPDADRDQDTVVDRLDDCPDVAGDADNHGCPRYKQIKVTSEKIELSQKIFFAYDKTEILPKSFGLLDEVAQALKDNPSLRVRIEGHTDSKGSQAYNLKLSDGRAASVRTYLVAHGVAADRLESRGYGPTLPLESNATSEGREKNRRVEFVIIDRVKEEQP